MWPYTSNGQRDRRVPRRLEQEVTAGGAAEFIRAESRLDGNAVPQHTFIAIHALADCPGSCRLQMGLLVWREHATLRGACNDAATFESR